MRELIFKKIEELQTKTPTLNKFFVFSIEELGADYEGCLESIEKQVTPFTTSSFISVLDGGRFLLFCN